MQVLGEYEANTHCRNCGSANLLEILPLGNMALANSLLTESELPQPEPVYPLTMMLCKDCSLAQLSASVSPHKMFDDYLYFSSYSTTMLEHVRKSANRLITERGLGPESLVVELASNDGYMLQYFREQNVPVLGVEPAANIAKFAIEKDIPTVVEYFGKEVAARLREEGKTADVVLANNVLAHVPALHSFVEGIRVILKPEGVAVIETPYVKSLLDDCKFDTIYHEHLFYYSLTALESLFTQHEMHIVDVEQISIHGGSLRIFAQHRAYGQRSEAVMRMLRDEERWSKDETVYGNFAENVQRTLSIARDVLAGLRASGRRVAAYGAAAKGAVFLNAAGIGPDLIDFVVDRNPHKQNHFMPGMHIPIRSPQAILEEQPDYLLILVWNFVDEIMAQMADYEAQGGRFMVAIPDLHIYTLRR